MCWSLFSVIFADLKSEILLNKRVHHGYFSMKKFYLKNTDISGRLLLILRKLDIQSFNSKYLNSSPNFNDSVLINIVGTLLDE